jgi:flagellar hook-associated protein 2
MINNNTMRISGLASGMNTDEIVDNLVKAQSSRLNKMQQTKILTNWKSDSYRDVNKKIDEFRKAMEGLRLQSSFNMQAVTSSDARIEVSSGGISTQSEFVISEATLPTVARPAIVSFDSKMASGSTVIGGTGSTDVTFTLNSQSITLTPAMTFDQAIAKINEKSELTKVKASNVGGSLVFTSTGTGEDSTIKVSDLTGSNNLGLNNPSPPDPLNVGDSTGLMNPIISVKGTKESSGTVTINNTQIHVSSNKFTYEGVTFNLKEKVASGANISVRVSTDTQGIFDNIKTFVDKYNGLIAEFNGKLTEKRYRDYPPLLEDQKKDMKENDIKLWDEKSKSGLLTNDSTIRSFLTEMRNSLNTVIENDSVTLKFKSLKEIGINFSSNYQDNGKLTLDESKLKGLLQTNPEDIKQLFTIKETGTISTSTTVTDSNMHKGSGFGWRVYDRLNLAISQLGNIAGYPNLAVDTKSTIAKQLKSLDANIYREQDKINAYEERMWKQFTAMEKALQQLNSQGSWLSQQLGL